MSNKDGQAPPCLDSNVSISEIIAAYKADFTRIDKDEIYKWQAIKWYKEHWNINAPDFAAMFASAFSKAGNLLTAHMYYPYGVLCEFAEMNPEAVKAMFQDLHNEKKPLSERYLNFRSRCDTLLTEYRNSSENHAKANNHYQDLHTISVYLSFEYPETYFIYKFKVYKRFQELIGFSAENGKNKSEVWKLENYNQMCQAVLDVVNSDTELLKLNRNRLASDCYQDEAHHLLTMDIIYFGATHMPAQNPPKSSTRETLENTDLSDTKLATDKKAVTDVPKNTILYGPPGTGKTYHTVIYAVAIIENKPLLEIEREPYEAVARRYRDYKANGLVEFTTFHQSYSYEEFIEGIKPVMDADGDDQKGISYELSSGLFKRFCERASQPILPKGDEIQENKKNYVFIIDEINRGNISKIFGELITLIEPTKRIGQPEEISVKLPYSQKLFGVPDNVYLIGTMNTADRSIAAIDTALRRRFHFKEMLPDPAVLEGIFVEDISIQELLLRMNLKISALYDREHTIGHAYFTKLREDPSLELLASIFQDNILPLLQEYFYEDYEKIRLVLGDNNKQNEAEQFITAKTIDYTALFGPTEFGMDDAVHYEINPAAFYNIESYRSI